MATLSTITRGYLLFIIYYLLFIPGSAQTVLPDVEVEYTAPAQGIGRGDDGTLRVSTSTLDDGIHTLGEADALRVAAMMPGVGATGDYASGLVIDGADPTRVVYTIDGARVFFPYRFGGMFSTFNPGHISAVTIGSGAPELPLAAGARVDAVTPWAVADDPALRASAGLLASSATLRAPLWSGASVAVSGRVSYINTLYGSWLDSDDAASRYGFGDVNVTLNQRCGTSGTLKASAFHSSDRLDFAGLTGGMDAALRWYNTAASVVYAGTTAAGALTCGADYSDMASRLDMGMPQLGFVMTSSVRSAALRVALDHGNGWRLSGRGEYCGFTPQRAGVDGSVDLSGSPAAPRMHSWLASFTASHSWPLAGGDLSAGARLSVYSVPCAPDRSEDYGARFCHIDPSLSYTIGLGAGSLSATAAIRTQYMHHLGLSDLGSASNYFIPATRLLPAERSWGADVRWSMPVIGRMLQLDAKVFGHRVTGAPEYSGSVIDLISDAYDPLASAVACSGYDVGGDITLTGRYGALSGWVGADLAVCRRHAPDGAGQGRRWFASAHEPLWSVKALAQWRVHPRCDLTASFTASAGRRYTAPEAIYIMGGNVLTEYGPRNGARLPSRQSLDVSATWHLPELKVAGRAVRHSLNLSVINAYGHRNIEMQYFVYDPEDATIRLRRVSSLYRLLPSLSYTLRW